MEDFLVWLNSALPIIIPFCFAVQYLFLCGDVKELKKEVAELKKALADKDDTQE